MSPRRVRRVKRLVEGRSLVEEGDDGHEAGNRGGFVGFDLGDEAEVQKVSGIGAGASEAREGRDRHRTPPNRHT